MNKYEWVAMIISICIITNGLIWICFIGGSNSPISKWNEKKSPPPRTKKSTLISKTMLSLSEGRAASPSSHKKNKKLKSTILEIIRSSASGRIEKKTVTNSEKRAQSKNELKGNTEEDLIRTKDFIIHINNANSFRENFSGSGLRFGLATPSLCPINPVAPNLVQILGASGGFCVNNTNPYNISPNNISSAISDAFSLWINNGVCNFSVQTGWTDDGTTANVSDILTMNSKNDILFFDLGNPSALAVTILWLQGGGIVEGDIIFNTNIGGSVISDLRQPNAPPGFNFFDIVIHEIGHLLGIGHTQNIPLCEPAIMFPSLPQNIRKEQLSEADKDGMRRLFESHGICSATSNSLSSKYMNEKSYALVFTSIIAACLLFL